MFIDRNIYSELKSHLNKKQITVITGIRRSGKTTLLKKLINDVENENKIFFDFEKISDRNIFSEENYDNIIEIISQKGINKNKKITIGIDEIQLSKNSPSVIKYLYDHYDIKFIVTGSASYYLKNLFSESLSGRKKLFELKTLSFGEYLKFKHINYDTDANFLKSKFSIHQYNSLKTFYNEYINYGGFPEVTLALNTEDKKELLKDILNSYINIDIKRLTDFRKSRELFNLISLLASRAGSKIDYTKLSRISGLSKPTVYEYIETFEKTYLVQRIYVFTKSKNKLVSKSPKIYFCDNGILNSITDVSSGIKLENSVFNQLINYGSVSYYSTYSNSEIDFVLDDKTAFEIKETPDINDLNILERRSKTAGIKNYRIIGNKIPNGFTDFIWAGSIF
jgi:predicted AAA+ superfamily ATPase